jgi:ubiquinone/menaquinone biosynthesis C-methylase UbiE
LKGAVVDLHQIKEHWTNLAAQFETNLKATTHTGTIKKLEVHALYQAFLRAGIGITQSADVLEVGCGNGYNCLSLSELFPQCRFTGLDYVPAMIDSALKLQAAGGAKYSRISFSTGDVLKLPENTEVKPEFDIVFTDRCLINLNTAELQLNAFNQLVRKVKSGGHLIILENSAQNYERQNDAREAVGLARRVPAAYNRFIDDAAFLSHAEKSMRLVDINEFGSLHDIVLYILVPMTNGGVVDYAHPLVKAATDLSIGISDKYKNAFGNFGQNRLFLFEKR